ncbi:hypothetical protein UK12_34305, partial [Saccharothrix sp. ST-888]
RRAYRRRRPTAVLAAAGGLPAVLAAVGDRRGRGGDPQVAGQRRHRGCGPERTADWPRRFRAPAVVYGHMHIPRTTVHDGVRFEEVSICYPREYVRRGFPRGLLREVLPPA